jgi:hypothetical protein
VCVPNIIVIVVRRTRDQLANSSLQTQTPCKFH